ncbi:MAG: hypothetical protein Q6373_004800 [Candidatus Sigynarchaeota archaeon]
MEESIAKNQHITPSRGIKAIVLLSGGLDSAVAARLMQEQGIDLVALNFHSPFCTCASNMRYNGCSATLFATKMNIPIIMLSKGDDYLEIVKNPRFGYGKNINPCIDCRIYLFKKAVEMMPGLGASFIVTGEVLGQRPKSQMRKALDIIDEEAGVKGLVLRPLSARLLPPTIPERKGWVNREKLLAIEGRHRNLQVELGKKFELIKQYCAGSGCLLTDSQFAAKMRDYFIYVAIPKMRDMQILKLGRHFRFRGIRIIVGRNEKENQLLESIASPHDRIITLKDSVGPSTVIRFSENDFASNIRDPVLKEEILRWAGLITCWYSKSWGRLVVVSIRSQADLLFEMDIPPDPTFLPQINRIGWALSR